MRFLRSKVFRKNLDVILIGAVIAVLAAASCIFIYSSKLTNTPIRSDGFSYYAYLPTVAIDHNLSFNLAKQNTYPGTNLASYSIGKFQPTGKMLTIVPPGTAILEAPFFVIADAFTVISGGQRTGYSSPYQIAIVISGIFYLTLGILILYVTLRRLFGKQIALLATLTIVFATNVFHYGTYDNSFSHIYSFAMVALFLYLLFRLRDLKRNDHHRYMWLIAIGACLGLITLIRVPNIIVGILLLPVLYEPKHSIKTMAKESLIVAAPFVIVLLPYLIYLIYAAGSIFTNPYTVFPLDPSLFPGYHLAHGKYGGFTNLRHPELINFLFSVRKGLFFWSPVLVLAFASVAATIKKMKPLGLAIAVVLCLQIYLCASWWAWAFGGSFGSRPFVDMMPLLGLTLAAGIFYVRQWINIKILWLVFAVFTLINLTLTYSYWRRYVSSDNMTFKLLREVPLNLRKEFQ